MCGYLCNPLLAPSLEHFWAFWLFRHLYQASGVAMLERCFQNLSGMIRAEIDSHDSRESGDSRESEIRMIRANRPDAL